MTVVWWFSPGITRRVPLVEQELPTLPEHLSLPPVFSGVRVTRSLVLYACFVVRCLYFCPFSFDHCVVCSSSIYGFWLPLWYLLAIVLFVLLRYTDYDCPFDIFWPLCCLFFFDIRILIAPLISSGHCVVCSSSIYGFWLPLWYVKLFSSSYKKNPDLFIVGPTCTGGGTLVIFAQLLATKG